MSLRELCELSAKIHSDDAEEDNRCDELLRRKRNLVSLEERVRISIIRIIFVVYLHTYYLNKITNILFFSFIPLSIPMKSIIAIN